MACPDCFSGQVHEGQPRGTTTKLHGLDVYVSEPTGGRQARGIIVIIPDGFGWDFVNNRILADHYADKGDYTVYLPDFMRGESRRRPHDSPGLTIMPGYSAQTWMLDSMRIVMTSGNYLSKA